MFSEETKDKKDKAGYNDFGCKPGDFQDLLA